MCACPDCPTFRSSTCEATRPGSRVPCARLCEAHGFFYVVGHGVDEALAARLDTLARDFFALPEAVKARYAMAHGGRAWRGWFPLGGELTSGLPDWKEGLYLGTELDDTHPRVRAGVPLHGRNLLPDDTCCEDSGRRCSTT